MNILVISPIYPGPGIGENYTKVVHYFVREWNQLGVNVRVISVPSYFPKLFYHIPKKLVFLIQKLFNPPIPVKRNHEVETYEIDGVSVCRVPLFKVHPWSKISRKILKKAAINIVNILKKSDFHPDVVVGHWFDPTIYFVDYLKQYYKCKSSLVIHNNSFRYAECVNGVDIWGCRKVETSEVFSALFPNQKISFRCYSGIPELFLDSVPSKSWSKIKRFIYVGTLIPRKYPDVVIEALVKSRIKDFELNIIGEGSLYTKLCEQVNKYNLHGQVSLRGRIERSEIIKELDVSDVFIMISKDEVFGLVYIEAMARGCIVIASEKEGMEGIIKNGYNGFLIPAGNEERLIDVINHISSMTAGERKKISECAQQTASELTDKKVAIQYLDKIKSII